MVYINKLLPSSPFLGEQGVRALPRILSTKFLYVTLANVILAWSNKRLDYSYPAELFTELRIRASSKGFVTIIT